MFTGMSTAGHVCFDPVAWVQRRPVQRRALSCTPAPAFLVNMLPASKATSSATCRTPSGSRSGPPPATVATLARRIEYQVRVGLVSIGVGSSSIRHTSLKCGRTVVLSFISDARHVEITSLPRLPSSRLVRGLADVPHPIRRRDQAPIHGSITSMPVSEKSPTFRVATAMPSERAIAAIWQSASGIGRPMRRRAAAISA